MIEQTTLIVDKWDYTPPVSSAKGEGKIISHTSFEVMKKRAGLKKGIACRFSVSFITGDEIILLYVAEDSYVIDLADKIDSRELLTMIRNSFSKFTEQFEWRKLGTLLQNNLLSPLDESSIDLAPILALLE